MSNLFTKSIKFTSRASVKIKDSYFTFEATIEKEIPPNFNHATLDEEKQILWDECNQEIDNQIAEIKKYLSM